MSISRDADLHVLNYSVPVNRTISLDELKNHVFSLPEQPDWIPYRTSYYKENWGFCLSHNQLSTLQQGEYEVLVEATLQNGHLTYGEYFLEGQSEDEISDLYPCLPSFFGE